MVRHELALSLSILDHPDLSGGEIRDRIERGTISNDKWLANETVLAQFMDRADWIKLSQAYLGARLLLDDVDRQTDSELSALGKSALGYIEHVDQVVWAKDPGPKGNLLNRIRGRA